MGARGKDAMVAKSKSLTGSPRTGAASSAAATTTELSTTTGVGVPKSSRLNERGKGSASTSSPTVAAITTPGTSSSTNNASANVVSTSTTTDRRSSSPSTAVAPPKTIGNDADAPPTLAKQVSATSSASSTDQAQPATHTDSSQCALCGEESGGAPDEIMVCFCCNCTFHARCANLPQTPEEGDTFCRWECFSAFRKSQDTVPRTPLGDLSKLAERVQSILVDMPRHGGSTSHGPPSLPPQGYSSREVDNQPRIRERSKRSLSSASASGRSRSPSPYQAHDSGVHGGLRGNGYGSDRRVTDDMGPRRPSPRGKSPATFGMHSTHIDLTEDDVEPPLPRSPRVRPARVGGRLPVGKSLIEEAEGLRNKRMKRLPLNDPVVNGPRGGGGLRRDSYPPPLGRRTHSPSRSGAEVYPNEIPPQYPGVQIPSEGPRGGDPRYVQGWGKFDHRNHSPADRGPPTRPMTGEASRFPPVDLEMNHRPSSGGRSSRSGSGASRYGDFSNEYETVAMSRDNGLVAPRSRPPSVEHVAEDVSTRRSHLTTDDSLKNRHLPSALPPAKYNIPWLNPAAFPAGLQERFSCKPDNVNGVFRIDLSPVFADKSMHLYQTEIDFFFRCFESADVSLVVKGMASELNQYIWAWPFILESCGSETHFSFDHFQFRHKAGELPELEYVGELRLSMAAYNAYLERYLSGSMANVVIVLEDHITQKPITLVAAENIIVLNDLVIAEHCTQLYNDLVKSFQWDVFAGGIHCLLQYLPQTSRDKRFSSPLLHFNFPGARGRLRDRGNGTTDTAYQVLVGSLELVIFERLDPKDRDAFHRVLRAAGFDASKKAMLLDAHLRVLRDAGFAWSTVLLSDGEFVHVNKGRLHFWRVVEPVVVRGPVVNAPCVFLSWEWVYQGVSQRGISTECWFAMKNASLCTGGWAFDPRRAIVEAAKCGVAIVRTGQFLNSLSSPGAPPVLMQLAFTGPTPAAIDRAVVAQRQEQMVLFLESILPCMDAIVEEEFELGLLTDDSEDFRKVFDDEIMWKLVDTALSSRRPVRADYECGICGLELTNIYKQCLGCTVHTRRSRPNVAYPVFRICVRCHAQPEHHHFKPRALHRYYDKLCSSEGHTGLLPATRRYQSERSYFKCRCTPYVRCSDCGGCESCCCLCHTLFQTRFRYTAPEYLDHLRTDVVDVIKWHKQQQLHRQQQQH